MNLAYKHLLPEDFAADSRVWVYQSSRLFLLAEALQIEDALNAFTADWRSHGAKVQGYGNLFFGRFLVLIADESATGVSGCSTDSSVRFVKELGDRYRVDFFNRTNLAFVLKDKIELLPLAQLSYAAQHGFVNADTLYFNNLVQTKKELEDQWLIPAGQSWLAPRLAKATFPS